MKNIKTNYEFDIKNISEFKTKIHLYLKYYDFNVSNHNSDTLVFYKQGNLLDAWRLNPLNWKSKIKIKIIEEKRVLIQYSANGNQEVSSHAFKSFYETFLNNLELFINHDKEFKESNSIEITLAKKRIARIYFLIIVGALIGLAIGIIILKLTGIKLFSYIGIIIGAIFVRKIMYNQLTKNNSITSQI